MAGRVVMNRAAVRQTLAGQLGPVVRAAVRYGRRVENAAKRKAPVDTGAGRASINLHVAAGRSLVVATIGTPLIHMLYQHEGTGIYGPRHRRITPVSRQFLRFPVKGTFGPVQGTRSGRAGKRKGRGNIVYARSVRGVPPNPFLVEALIENVPWPVVVTRR